VCYTNYTCKKEAVVFGENHINLDFKLLPCTECCMLSFGWFPGIWNVYADVSEHSVCSNFIGTHLPAYEAGTDRVFRNIGI